MADKIMVDTNVLLYAYDRGEPVKQPQALAVLDNLTKLHLGILTPQVLAEFFVNATRKLEPPLTVEEAYERIENYLLAWEILDLTGSIVLEAVRGVHTYKMAYWDAQIWASARLHQVNVIFSEDFNTGAVIEGIRFVNPFARGFDLKSWISE
ncbi:MAG: PIN domain-containing protein [Deltaproteobacteria bacterium]|nr:PIN domain-containing protein [Deltaproteobacteria bacterium]MBW1735956.1 PIN domain-containing protein [Deltaproteobacteria bacterium]MBW1908265.1 PIN domain-containing protein [Deltaproteobacteria bacterium]MBW2032247.1 PIN domain-containing protein [Deltaproteobacteria bacterium]MBW2113260.1 PIN domain-containing protein [Deltaproteobacteria bacterium]